MSVAEQTGSLDEMLTKIADFYYDEVDAAGNKLLRATEPAMIVFLGVVGGVVIAIYPQELRDDQCGVRIGVEVRSGMLTLSARHPAEARDGDGVHRP